MLNGKVCSQLKITEVIYDTIISMFNLKLLRIFFLGFGSFIMSMTHKQVYSFLYFKTEQNKAGKAIGAQVSSQITSNLLYSLYSFTYLFNFAFSGWG